MKLTNEIQFVWDFFRYRGLTRFGVAGLLGNLYAESGINPIKLEMLCIRRYLQERLITYTDAKYTANVDNGTITKEEFCQPLGKHYGYGLAQWTTTARKAGLYNYTRQKNVSIGDLEAQCEYLYSELQNSFKATLSVLTSAQDVNTASDYVLLHFEMPAEAEKCIKLRRRYSNEVFDLLGQEEKMVIIGSARIDENGNSHGGKPGDQTGKEVSIQEYYTHSKGWRVIRAKDDVAREAIAQDMEWACANDNIGYDQNQNQTLYNVVKNYGFDCSKVTIPVETDCARLVRVCVLFAGIPTADFYTASEAETLLATGAFDEVYPKLPSGLKRGDILVTKTKGHTVVALTNGDGSTNKDDKDDSPVKYSIGWHEDNNGWWYADSETTYLKDTWQLIEHHWYYFDSKGYMATGWTIIEGKIYYLQESDDGNKKGALWRSDGSGAQGRWYVK